MYDEKRRLAAELERERNAHAGTAGALVREREESARLRGELDEARAAVRSQNDLAIERLHRAVAADERLAEALDLMREFVTTMPWHIAPSNRVGGNGNGPGHGHWIPGVWDDDHPPGKRGMPCEWCALWKRILALLSASPPPASGTPGNEG